MENDYLGPSYVLTPFGENTSVDGTSVINGSLTLCVPPVFLGVPYLTLLFSLSSRYLSLTLFQSTTMSYPYNQNNPYGGPPPSGDGQYGAPYGGGYPGAPQGHHPPPQGQYGYPEQPGNYQSGVSLFSSIALEYGDKYLCRGSMFGSAANRTTSHPLAINSTIRNILLSRATANLQAVIRVKVDILGIQDTAKDHR